jgi:serine/threonine protein kinase
MPAANISSRHRHRHHRTNTTESMSSSFRRTSITLDGGNKEIALTGASLVSQEAARTLKFEDHYILQEQLAKGSFGTVYATEHVETGDAASFAVKVIERSRLSEKDKDLVLREVAILNECRDIVNVVQLVDFYDSPEKMYVVQVRAMGGDVFGRLASRNSYNEKNARDLAYHLIVAMKALHERRIAHRDLKPENLLLRDKDDDTSILVADFGFAKHVPTMGSSAGDGGEGRLTSRCGTPAFVAPEVLVKDCQYTEQVDMWSTGCLLFMIICGMCILLLVLLLCVYLSVFVVMLSLFVSSGF